MIDLRPNLIEYLKRINIINKEIKTEEIINAHDNHLIKGTD